VTAIALIVAACGSSGLTPFKWDFDIPGYGLWSSLKTIHFNDLCLNIASIPMVAAGMGWSIVPESFRRILPNDVARKTRPPSEAASNRNYQIYFAAIIITTAATMANTAIWTAMLFIKPRLFLSICAVMVMTPLVSAIVWPR
jgi:uncharacterized MAPEG superfamily protein